MNEVAIFVQPRFSSKTFVGLSWLVGSCQWHVKKVRFVFGRRIPDEARGFLSQLVQYFIDHEILSARSLANKVRELYGRLLNCRQHCEAIVSDVDVRRHVQRRADAEV